jgi:hypothetical protein
MIVELAKEVRFQAKNIEGVTYQSTLFPEPAAEEEDYQTLQRVSAELQLTLPMDPQQGALSGYFPFGESVAINKPYPGVSLPRFEGDVVVFPGIRWIEPIMDVSLQAVTCHMVSALISSDVNARKLLTFQLVFFARPFM